MQVAIFLQDEVLNSSIFWPNLTRIDSDTSAQDLNAIVPVANASKPTDA